MSQYLFWICCAAALTVLFLFGFIDCISFPCPFLSIRGRYPLLIGLGLLCFSLIVLCMSIYSYSISSLVTILNSISLFSSSSFLNVLFYDFSISLKQLSSLKPWMFLSSSFFLLNFS